MKKIIIILALIAGLQVWSQKENAVEQVDQKCLCKRFCGTNLCLSEDIVTKECPKAPITYYKTKPPVRGTHILVPSVSMPCNNPGCIDPDILYIEYADGHIWYPNGAHGIEVLISPNPIETVLNFKLEENDFITASNILIDNYQIIDQNGNIRKEDIVNSLELSNLNIDDLQNGNYFLHLRLNQTLENGNNTLIMQFIKQ